MSRTDRSRRPSNVPRPEMKRPVAKRAQEAPRSAPPAPASTATERAPIQRMPDWKWTTFPVFFALALGLFIGVFVGVPSGIASEQGNSIPSLVIFLGSAIILGFALSRITTRWLLARNWPRARKRS